MTDASPERFTLDRIVTPIGELSLLTDAAGCLRMLSFGDGDDAFFSRQHRQLHGAARIEPGAAPAAIRGALEAYFAGELSALATIPWRTTGTPFQQAVWTALTTIPVGQTWSYGELAARIGNPRAVRAVGLANGSNPVAVVVPCHRVIGADKSLTGYGGGLPRKRWLLKHEGAAFVEAERSLLLFPDG